MALSNVRNRWWSWEHAVAALVLLCVLTPALKAQSGNQQPANPPTQSQPAQDIPDAPSAVQPPLPKITPPVDANRAPIPAPDSSSQPADRQQNQEKQPPPPMPPIVTVPPGSVPRNQINPAEDLYKLVVPVHFVLLPVLVKYTDGRPVDGLLPKDFTVLENGKKQTLTYFSSDPFQLSAAIVLDTGMADVTFQRINQTYTALVGAFSPYDEVALYTYSSTVSQVSDFTQRPEKLTAFLNEMKLVRGHNNGPPDLGGPLASGPTVNGAPVGGPVIAPVNTPPREAHVLNDAILRAAIDLSKRDKTRRKVIFVISDGRELGSQASYKSVLKLLQTRDIAVKAVVVDTGALPGYRQLEKFHLPRQGYSEILPKYVFATCGGQVFNEISRNNIEEAYAEIASEARNQYTLGYTPPAAAGNSTYRTVEVRVDKRDLKISAKDGYYPIPGR